MTQADRYDLLHDYLHNKKLDGSYQAAMYILSSSEDMTEEVLPYLSMHGIDFELYFKEVEYTGSDAVMAELARDLFSWKSENPPSPHDLAMLGYPLTEIALEAIYIASGLHQVIIEYDKEFTPVLSINKTKQEQANEWHTKMGQFPYRQI